MECPRRYPKSVHEQASGTAGAWSETPTRSSLGHHRGWLFLAKPALSTVVGATPTSGTISRLGSSGLCLAVDDFGHATVTDLACPHRGVHLSLGHVDGEGAVVCAAHHTRFSRAGDVIGGPSTAPLRRRPAHTSDLGYWVWPHSDPPTPIPDIAELNGRAVLAEGTRIGPYDWRDIGENAVDSAHISALHGTPTLPQVLDYTADYGAFRVTSTITWTTGPNRTRDGHVQFEVFKPGVVVVRFSGIARLTSIVTWWPLQPNVAVVTWQVVMTDPNPRPVEIRLGEHLVGEVEAQLLDDLRIWEHKGPRGSVRLGPLDRHIASYREWADL